MKALTGSSLGVPAPMVGHRPNRLRSWVQVLVRRRLVVLRTTVVLVAIAALTCVLITRRYTAIAEIQIQQPQPALAGDTASASASAADPTANSTNLQTRRLFSPHRR